VDGDVDCQQMPLHEVVHQVEAVLDLLQDELERQQHQKLTGGAGMARAAAGGAGGGGAGTAGGAEAGLLRKAGSRYLQVRAVWCVGA
jgi:hypothetical protein